MAEAFRERGLATTVVELLPRIMSTMDPEFGSMIAAKLEERGVRVISGLGLKSIRPAERADGKAELSDGTVVDAGIVLLSIGVRPELALAKAAGLAIGGSGGLEVDDELRTSDPRIYAAGDMVEILHKVSGRKVRVPLAGPANRQGRIAASNALGMHLKYRGGLARASSRPSTPSPPRRASAEKPPRERVFDTGAAIVFKDHHASYYPGAKELVLKLVYDRKSSRLLGAQAFGTEGVEKRIDVLATALHGEMSLDDLAELDLSYAPPFSSANDPVNVAAFVAQNDVSGFGPLETAAELRAALAAAEDGGPPALVLDVRNVGEYEDGHVPGAFNLPLDELRFRLDEVPRGVRVHLHCRSGFRAHLALESSRKTATTTW